MPKEKPIDKPKWQLIQHVQRDYQKGLRITKIAKKYELSRGSIYNYLKRSAPPRKTKRKIKPAQLKLQPYYETIIGYVAEHFTTDQILEKIRLTALMGVVQHFAAF